MRKSFTFQLANCSIISRDIEVTCTETQFKLSCEFNCRVCGKREGGFFGILKACQVITKKMVWILLPLILPKLSQRRTLKAPNLFSYVFVGIESFNFLLSEQKSNFPILTCSINSSFNDYFEFKSFLFSSNLRSIDFWWNFTFPNKAKKVVFLLVLSSA